MQVRATSFNFSLKDIVMFTTGIPHKPPLGFMPTPSLGFIRYSTFPIANTCANVLNLPTMHTSVKEFTWYMCYGILNAAGFGLV